MRTQGRNNPTDAENLGLVDSKWLAARLGCTRRFVAILAQRGEIPSLRLGTRKALRFAPAKVCKALGIDPEDLGLEPAKTKNADQ